MSTYLPPLNAYFSHFHLVVAGIFLEIGKITHLWMNKWINDLFEHIEIILNKSNIKVKIKKDITPKCQKRSRLKQKLNKSYLFFATQLPMVSAYTPMSMQVYICTYLQPFVHIKKDSVNISFIYHSPKPQ